MGKLRTFIFVGLGVLILGEGILRLLPVSQGFYLDNITPDQPIARRVADRQATTSTGWNMSGAVSVPINAQGFIYGNDFRANSTKPVTVLIGDSQIEAPLIPWEKSLSHGLEKRLKGDMRVYPVGMSGAPLSQYLIWHQYMNDAYAPQTTVFFISANDYVESFEAYGLFPGFHYFNADANGDVSLELRTYRRTIAGRVASLSSLVAYVLNNLDGVSFLSSIFSAAKLVEAEQAHQQLSVSATSNEGGFNSPRLDKGRLAIELFFQKLPRNGPGQPNVVFAMNPDTHNDPLSNAFRRSARERGYRLLELSDDFDRTVAEQGQELTYPGDVHWNARGQGVVADALASFLCPSCDS